MGAVRKDAAKERWKGLKKHYLGAAAGKNKAVKVRMFFLLASVQSLGNLDSLFSAILKGTTGWGGSRLDTVQA